MNKKAAFAGIDLGTTGIRIIVADERGKVLSVHTQNILDSTVRCDDPRASEQDPRFWKEALFGLLPRALVVGEEHELRAICVDSTSGTVIAVDAEGKPLSNALLHNDERAQAESAHIKDVTGINAKPSFALSKILWMKNNEPDLFELTDTFVHAADFIKGLVSGDFRITDFSNAVKTGYDLGACRWPASIDESLHIPLHKLPEVVKTGEKCGELRRDLREKWGIPKPVPLVAGATDSTTSFYSSGAERVGDWNTTVGTVLGIRGISPDFIEDPLGLLYAHRHPEGYWLPGAASNTGGEAVRMFFGDRLGEYDEKIEGTPPTGALIYPLVRGSEKFPFLNSNAQGFVTCALTSPSELFKGFLEGVAFVERMIYERIEAIGYAVGDRIYTMGGGAYSVPWMRLRSDILNKAVCRAREVEAAFGAAIIAASGVHFGSLTEAQEHMVTIQAVMEPDGEHVRIYDDLYGRFLEECRARGLFT